MSQVRGAKPTRVRLTKTSVEAIPLPKAGYCLVYDTELRGFGVRVTAAGVRSYVYEYRVGRRSRRDTLGRHGVLTVEQAKKEAKRRAGQVAVGQDPTEEERRHRAQAVTLAEAWSAYISVRNLKARSRHDMARLLATYLKDWRGIPVASITPDMCAARHRHIGKRSQAQANLSMRVLRAVLNWASEEYAGPDGKPLLPVNPVGRLSRQKAWFKVERRRTLIRRDQMPAWLAAVMSLPDVPKREPGTGKEMPRLRNGELLRDYFLLLVLTGLRRTEALGLRWADVDLNAGTLMVRDTKNRRDHLLPLSRYLIERLRNLRGHSGPVFVFSDAAGQRLSNFRVGIERVCTSSGVKFTPHDLRRTFATALGRDAPAYVVKQLMNHASGSDVTADYINIDLDDLRQYMERATTYLLGQSTDRVESKTPGPYLLFPATANQAFNRHDVELATTMNIHRPDIGAF